MPIALSSPIVGDWKSLLSNFGGTGPDPTLGRSAEAVVLHMDAAVVEVEGVTGSTDTEGELEPGDVQEGSPVAGASEDKTATLETTMVGMDEAEASDCACLTCFLVAALVCQPHEHGLSAEGVKKIPIGTS